MTYWSDVDDLISKGKGSKGIKVTADELAQYRKQAEDKISSLQKELNNSKELVESLQKELVTLNNVFLALKTQSAHENEAMKSQLNKEKNDFQGCILEKESKITVLENLIKNREQDQKQKTIEINVLKESLAKKQHEFDQKITEIKSLKEDLNTAQKVIDQKNEELASFQAQLDEKIEEIQLAQTDLEQKAFSAGDEVKVKDQQITKSLSDLQSTVEEKIKLNNEIQKLSDENKKLQTEIENKNTKIVELEAQLGPVGPTGEEGERVVCPKCGSHHIREVDDKSRVISYIPRPIYGKKHVCSQCTYEWV